MFEKIKNFVRDNITHGTYINKKGYEQRYRPESPSARKSGWAPTHRVNAEEKLGGQIYKNKVVHHRDGNKLNNDKKNLQILTRKQHYKKHYKDRKSI